MYISVLGIIHGYCNVDQTRKHRKGDAWHAHALVGAGMGVGSAELGTSHGRRTLTSRIVYPRHATYYVGMQRL